MLRRLPSRFLRFVGVDARSGDHLARLAAIATDVLQKDVYALTNQIGQRSIWGPAFRWVIDSDVHGVATRGRSLAPPHRWFSTDKSSSEDGKTPESAGVGEFVDGARAGEGGKDGDPAEGGGPPTLLDSFGSVDDALEAWGAALDKGDWDTAWQIFDQEFPVDTPEFPSIEEMLAWNPEEEERAQRRQREEALQEQAAMLRTRNVDDSGRSHAVGKRKTSVARVWLRQGPGHVMVNRRPYDAYFPIIERRNDIIAPFLVTDTLGKFDVMAAVHGGGQTGQAQALRHGIARALQAWDPDYRPELKAAGLLTRDARIVERKKPGLKKARKAFQWVKR